MMDGIILAALALLSVPVLLVVILVKVCGLENKVTDLALKLTVIDFKQRHKDTEFLYFGEFLCASVSLCSIQINITMLISKSTIGPSGYAGT